MLVDLTHCNLVQGMQQDKEAMQQLKQQLSTLQSSEAESKAQLRRNLESNKSSHQTGHTNEGIAHAAFPALIPCCNMAPFCMFKTCIIAVYKLHCLGGFRMSGHNNLPRQGVVMASKQQWKPKLAYKSHFTCR